LLSAIARFVRWHDGNYRDDGRYQSQRIGIIAKAPARTDGTFDGIATFGGVMPTATQL